MHRKLGILAAAVPLLVLATVATAQEPVQLSESQMDDVTAGGSAFADALAQVVGAVAFSQTAALADVRVIDSFSSEVTTIRLVQSQAQAQSLSDTSP
jgi:hypothetical protein